MAEFCPDDKLNTNRPYAHAYTRSSQPNVDFITQRQTKTNKFKTEKNVAPKWFFKRERNRCKHLLKKGSKNSAIVRKSSLPHDEVHPAFLRRKKEFAFDEIREALDDKHYDCVTALWRIPERYMLSHTKQMYSSPVLLIPPTLEVMQYVPKISQNNTTITQSDDVDVEWVFI